MVNERKSLTPGRAWHADSARPPARPRGDPVLAGDGQACTDSLSDEHGRWAVGARHRSTLIPLCPSWHWKVDGRWYEVGLTTGLHIPPTRALQVVQCGRLQPTTDCLVQLSHLAVGARAHRDAEFALRLWGTGYGARCRFHHVDGGWCEDWDVASCRRHTVTSGALVCPPVARTGPELFVLQGAA